MNDQYHGKLNPKIWSDLTSLEEIRSLPADSLHQNTETIIANTIRDHGTRINIAIMCPPDIYGKGKGLAKTHSVFVPMLIDGIKNLGGKVFYYGEGTNTRSWVHMDELMVVYMQIVEAAASGGDAAGGYFNENGYFFAGTQEHSHLDIATVTGRILHQQGVVAEPEPKQISLEELDASVKIAGFEHMKVGRYLFASNSRTRAERAEKLFGYKGKSPSLLESLESEIMAAI
jgi:nucleoside-diphosphate-sugar epimerase